MFLIVDKVVQRTHDASQFRNPGKQDTSMVLHIFRQHTRSALFAVYAKKAFAEYWDDRQQKKISSKLWTSEMKTFAKQKAAAAPRPPYIFKFTILGWVFVALLGFFVGTFVWDAVKPVNKPIAQQEMAQAPVVGDIFFGHYEAFTKPGAVVATQIGFGWFKIVKVDGDDYYVAKATEMSKTAKPADQLNSTSFETESTAVKIKSQTGYNINLKSSDGVLEVYFTEKK